jgi:hypothetical protein
MPRVLSLRRRKSLLVFFHVIRGETVVPGHLRQRDPRTLSYPILSRNSQGSGLPPYRGS